MEANCGDNSSDDVIYWVYEGYEYLLGLKAGSHEKLIELANAAIIKFHFTN